MSIKKGAFYIVFIFCISGVYSTSFAASLTAAEIKKEEQAIKDKLGRRPELFKPWLSESVRAVLLERVAVSADQKTVRLYCNEGLAQIAIRYELLDEWSEAVRKKLGDTYKEADVKFYAYNIPAESFIPNYYRPKNKRDAKRASTPINRRPLVRPLGESVYGQGLSGRHIALWAGHGRLYHHEDSAWKWQRPALFTTIEDLNTTEYVNQYLAPMLENAGAVVVMPRERDPQTKEIIIDSDRSTPEAMIEMEGNWTKEAGGFQLFDTLVEQNPFRLGSVLKAPAQERPQFTYRPGLKTAGRYGVYVSWKALSTNLTNAVYTVYHAGGESSFEVNQTIGGGMWVWLGQFDLNSDSRVVLSAPDGATGTLTADAVKIGGGMGHIKRGVAGQERVSGFPRYLEAARYWMQYSGVVDSVYAQDTKAKTNKDSLLLDYTDSFKATGDWCNFIRRQKGIPLDIAVGIHTDAGICDSIIGTLSIHYTNKTRNNYTNGKSKMAGRDLADLIQTQVVNDIRAKYDPKWTRRSMYDKSYAEISRPDVPAMLLEIFSHQNANDMAVAMDPAFRFDVSRAVYKGILRFLSERYGTSYVVQPLPPASLQAEFTDEDNVRISWRPTVDPLEPTAVPTYYKIYRRSGLDGSFDNGQVVRQAEMLLPAPKDGQIYSYRITAHNEGGESFPSEVIALGHPMTDVIRGHALVVNGYTRVSPPAVKRDAAGKVLGLDVDQDSGVPWGQDRALAGRQKDFNPLSTFKDNDNPGWGASTEEWVPNGRTGNTFDYAASHGAALLAAGYAFVSCSREAFERMAFRPSRYALVDLLLGKQRSYPARYSVYSPALVKQLQNVVDGDVPLILSGTYLTTDPSYTPRVAEWFRKADPKRVILHPVPLEELGLRERVEILQNVPANQ